MLKWKDGEFRDFMGTLDDDRLVNASDLNPDSCGRCQVHNTIEHNYALLDISQ